MATIAEKLMNGAGLAELWAIIGEKYGGINRHWWKCRTVSEGYVAVPKTVTAVAVSDSKYYYSDAYTISEDGEFVLTDPETTTMEKATTDLKGKYFMKTATGTPMFYAAPDAGTVPVQVAGPGGISTVNGLNPVTTYTCELSTGYGEWRYLSADDRGAFQDIGVVDGLEYVYLGVPFENARDTPVKNQTGSYVGTGTYGEENALSLTFDFEPKLLIILSDITSYCDWFATATMNYSAGSGGADSIVNWNGNTVSWYNDGGTSATYAKRARNYSGATYHYIAIG